jgi:hypothetical protein
MICKYHLHSRQPLFKGMNMRLSKAVRKAIKAETENKPIPEFLNHPVWPEDTPPTLQPGTRWVFARSVAVDLLSKHVDQAPEIYFNKLTNSDLGHELVKFQLVWPEQMGGVVDDGKPNGIMPKHN